jgi:hypothetical protein
VVAIEAALLARAKTGEGQHIDMSLLDVQVSVLANQALFYLASGTPPKRMGSAHPTVVPYQNFPVKGGGYIIIAVGNDAQFARFAKTLGLPELADDERYRTNAGRIRNRDTLIPMLIEKTKERGPPSACRARAISRRWTRFYDRPITAHRLPAGGRRRDDGGGGRQGHRPARHLLRHPRSRRHQRLLRHPHRQAGLHADDRVRRPGRARMREREAFQELDYRAVFGTMAKWATEIDDPARIPEIVSRAFYVATATAAPGPVVIALPEDMLTERAAVPDAPPFRAGRDLAGPRRHGETAEDALGGEARRWCSLGGSRWSEAGPRSRALPSASTCRCDHLPPRAAVRCAASVLRRRPRHRAEPEAAFARARRRPRRADRRAARRDAVAELHAARHSGPRQTFVHVHPGSDELGRVYRPHLAINASPTAFAQRSKALQPPNDIPGRASAQGRACGLSRMDREGDAAAGRGQSRRDHGVAARQVCRTTISATAPATSPSGRSASSGSRASAQQLSRRHPARWATACRRRSRSSGSIRSAPCCASPATATS